MSSSGALVPVSGLWCHCYVLLMNFTLFTSTSVTHRLLRPQILFSPQRTDVCVCVCVCVCWPTFFTENDMDIRNETDLQSVVFSEQLFLREQVPGLNVLQAGRPLLTLKTHSITDQPQKTNCSSTQAVFQFDLWPHVSGTLKILSLECSVT